MPETPGLSEYLRLVQPLRDDYLAGLLELEKAYLFERGAVTAHLTNWNKPGCGESAALSIAIKRMSLDATVFPALDADFEKRKAELFLAYTEAAKSLRLSLGC